MAWKRKAKAKPADIRKSTEGYAEQLAAQKPKVTFISTWLENRYRTNGFGDDFEISLIPKEAK